jgi:hypothetical protein
VRCRGSHIFLENRLTNGGDVASLMRRPPFNPWKIPGTHFYYRLTRPWGHSAAERIRSIEKSNDLFGNRTHNLPSCSIIYAIACPNTTSCSSLKVNLRYGGRCHFHLQGRISRERVQRESKWQAGCLFLYLEEIRHSLRFNYAT